MGRKKSRHQKKEPYEQGIIPSGKPEEIKIREFIPESTEDLGALVVGDAPRFESPGLGRLTFIGGPSIFGEEYFAQEFELQFNSDSKALLGSKESSFIKRIEQKYEHIHLTKTNLDEFAHGASTENSAFWSNA